MKKIMFGMVTLSAIFFVILSFFTYIMQVDDIRASKVSFHIATDLNYSFDDLITNLEIACSESNSDILVRTYQYEKNSSDDTKVTNHIYKTNNKKDFLTWHTETGSCIVPEGFVFSNIREIEDEDSDSEILDLYMPKINGNYVIHSLSSMKKENWNAVVCYTDYDDYHKLNDECSKYGIKLEENGGIYLDSNYWVILLAVMLVLLGLSFLSMLFTQLSESKKIAMKRLDGYSCLKITFDSIMSYLKGFSVIILLSFILGCVVCSIWENINIFSCYLFDYKWKIFSFIAAWIVAFVISCIYISFIYPLYAIKGSKKRKPLYYLTVIAKICLIAVMGLVSFISYSGFLSLKNSMAIKNNMSSKFEDYFHLVCNTNINLISRDKLDEKFHNFYFAIENDFAPILCDSSTLDALSNMTTEQKDKFTEEMYYINNHITVNLNYLKINPVHDANGQIISIDNIPKDKYVLLIPDDMDEDLVKKAYMSMSAEENYSFEDIYIMKYLAKQRFYHYSVNLSNQNEGYFIKPIVIIEQKFTYPFGWFGNGSLVLKAKSNDYFNEILPYTEKQEVSGYISNCVSVSREISAAVEWDKKTSILYLSVLIISLILLCSVILYECMIYYKNNQKIITLKKMNGFSFIQIHIKHMIFRLVFYILVILYFIIVGCPFWFGIIVSAFDYSCFYLVLESKTSKYAATVLKGDLS